MYDDMTVPNYKTNIAAAQSISFSVVFNFCCVSRSFFFERLGSEMFNTYLFVFVGFSNDDQSKCRYQLKKKKKR
jgi:hypothetical protein